MTLSGSCLCGGVKVEVDDSALPLTPVVCHCKNCQTTASSYASLVAIVPQEKVKFEGETKTWTDRATTSGNTVLRSFCPGCGSPVQTLSPALAGQTVIKYGLFMNTESGKIANPGLELFTRNRNPWEKAIEGCAQFEEGP